ncbi:5'a2rel-related protein [Leishmania major strain Friedlin]|uniref:5'a2rel-related protein n=1 Tax=Leishmania major TaxID=5664 RepID=Q4QBS7_LEIMA|nr:5'a2rel-related protein [Leishmania major strain Friedlin]CAG9573936.1 5'a2rel-related_protein [Leishmania major strain Friedlin]CAJ04262.1 5'a2rel-related protein [Leishmania major strain Friedlin]|eukprot:XP_001683221.1 5'a2rel-related protein [Leishmania major strain Friedlin]
MMDITIGSPSSSYRSCSRSSRGYTQRPDLARDAASSGGSSAAGQGTELLTSAVGLDDTNDGGEGHHARCSSADSHGGFGEDRSDLDHRAAGASRPPPSLGEREQTCRPPPPNTSAAPAPQHQVTNELVYALSNRESLSPAQMTPSSIPFSASLPSSSSSMTGSGGAAHLPPRRAPQLLPHDHLHSRVEGMVWLCSAADRDRAPAPIPWASGRASCAAEERKCTDDAVGVRGPRASSLEAQARASEPTAVAAAAPVTRWPERQEQVIPRAFARTESPSPLRRVAQMELATGDAERNAAAEASPGTEVSGARCGSLRKLALPSFCSDGGLEVMDNQPRSERALRLARVSNTVTLSSPPALSSTSTSAVPLPGPPRLSSASSPSVPVQQQRLRLPSHSPESVSSASLSRAVVRRESLRGASATAATSSDSYDRGEAHDHHCSRRKRSDSRYRAVGDMDDDDGTTSSSPGLTETSGARPPSHAPAPLHPSSFLTQVPPHACRSLQSSSDSAKECGPGEAQRADAARQALDPSQASSLVPSPLASRSPSLSAAPPAQLPLQRTVEETRRDSSSNGDGSGAARRTPRYGTCPAMTEVAELQLPLATPTEAAVGCGGSGAAAVVSESLPPLPPAPRGAGDGASSLHPSCRENHRHSKSSATEARGVVLQAAASEADMASEARAGDGEARASRERKAFPAAASLRDGVAAALELDGARRGAAPPTDAPCHVQPPPPQRRALDRWRSQASLVGSRAADTTALSSSLRAATHSSRGSAAGQVTERDDGHPSQSARECGEAGKRAFKGGVNVARWVRSTVGGEGDLSGASLIPPPVRKAAEARVCAPPTNLGSASATSASGTAGDFGGNEPPRVLAVSLAALPRRTPPREAVAPAVLAEVTQSCASAALVSGRQAYQGMAALSWTLPSRSRVRLTVIASPAQERWASRAEGERAVGGAAQVDPRDRSSGARWREAGSAGEAFLVRSDAHRVEVAAVPQRAHPVRSSSSGQRASRPGLAAVLAPRTSTMCGPASSAEVDGADEDKEMRIVARTWRPVTCLEFVRDDDRRRSTGDDCQSSWGAAGTHRWGQGPHHPRAAQRSAAIVGALSGGHQTRPAHHPHDGSHGCVLSIEASPLVSPVSLAAEATSDVGASTRQACSAATWRAGAASNGVGGVVLSSTTLVPGYAAVYSPRMLATRVLEARKALLGAPSAAVPAAPTSVCPPGPSGALPLHCGSRAMPAVGATVAAAAASTSGGVSSWSPSSLLSPPHAHIDLKERGADDGVMPGATADAAPWSLYLSGSPDAEESMRHRTALPRQLTRGQQHLHEQPDLPADTSPYPVARRIPFGFAAGTLAGAASVQAVSPSPDGRLRSCHARTASPAADASAPVPGAHLHAEGGYQRARRLPCHTPAEEQRSVTASAPSSPIVARSAAASVAAPLGRMLTTLSPTTASSSAPRASSAGTAQGRHQSIPPPEQHAAIHAAGAGSQASERACSTSRRFWRAATNADQSHDAPDARPKRQSRILAQQRLVQEEAFHRRYIRMQEDHRFAVEVTELNYQRAVEYVHQASAAGAVATPARRSGHCAALLTTDCDAEPLAGLQRVRRDQAAMTATLSTLAKELAALSP